MTDDTEATASTGGADGSMEADDLARYAAAAAAADDPEQILGPATEAFGDMHKLVQAGDRLAASGASLTVQDLCLQLCASEAGSARDGDDKQRFLCIMMGWAWPRVPAIGAVLETSRAWELQRWGSPSKAAGDPRPRRPSRQ